MEHMPVPWSVWESEELNIDVVKDVGVTTAWVS